MANTKNLAVISNKLLERMTTIDDKHVKQNLVTKLLQLCDRFQPADFAWYINTVNKVRVCDFFFECTPNQVSA